MQKLSDLCNIVNYRIAVSDLDLDTYISTENMLPNKGGITKSSGLPTNSKTLAFKMGDVLFSNIRPYFKKLWLANISGGCSNDVIVLRTKPNCYPGFLYYLLSHDSFFDYATATSKGTKMPRGDKSAIMNFKVPYFPIENQIIIADSLSALDGKININGKINQDFQTTQKSKPGFGADGPGDLQVVVRGLRAV